ncbi:MAG: glycosyltransferase family 2 protein [Gammaproteobacteria bacterium]|nr:glycosyltransferase family 2 protein [Gammaproteobacteria bacterium]
MSNLKPIKCELSIIVPMYNEEESAEFFFERIEQVLDASGIHYEIICINDGSQDRTLEQLLVQRTRNPVIKIIDLSRNFGKEAALTAGLEHCTGAAVIPIDVDLQDPPELIPHLMSKWREGYDIVYGVRATRTHDGFFKKITAQLFYKLYNVLTDIYIPHDAGDFRLLDRRVVEALKQLPEHNRFMKGLFCWVGFRQIGIPYDRPARKTGSSKWNYWRLWNFALDGITAFSTLPLRVWSYIGVIISLLAFLYATFLLLRTLIMGIDLPGYASLMVVILFLGGIQLISLGIIGEYLARLCLEAKQRPIYLTRELYGLSPKE